MATKKKTKTKQKKSKKSSANKRTSAKQPAKKAKAPKRLAKKKVAPKKAAKKQTAARKPIKKKAAPHKKQANKARPQANRLQLETQALPRKFAGSSSGEESGDLQGLSRREQADSESVDELLEEGNAFEAEVIQGVEDAGDHDEQEVHTHEVPEDDVPEEYLDKD
jgi:hypothetical protein